VIPLGISNSSALIGLGRIGRLDLVESAFEALVVPKAVAEEVGELPSSVMVEEVAEPRLIAAFPIRVHRGEAEVILLGLQKPGAVLVLDDWFARKFAADRGLAVIGTIGLILRAKASGRLDRVGPTLSAIRVAGFRVSDRVIDEALALAGER
jgi:predicted nucleic acid-binding protein